MTEQCGNCRFWLGGENELKQDEFGLCRRYPEAALKAGGSWCGEWTPDVMAEIEKMGKESYEPHAS